MEEGVAEKKEHDLTAILHLGPPATIAGSPSSEVLKSFEKISDEARQIVEKLAPEDAMLIVHRGPGQGSRFLVTGIGATIGRSPESDIFLDDVTVLNGTYVNGKHVVEISLVNGDEIQIGKFHMLFLGGKK
jgi:hypothetical protein